MYISDLKLVDFRNYEDERISFSKGINILVGANAQGKTNLLEAVYYCSKGRSFKTKSDKSIIRRGRDGFVLDAQIIKGKRHKLIHIESEDRLIKINNIKVQSLEEMKNQFEIVYFTPEDLRIIKDGPDLRRRLVDDGLTNIRPSFKSVKKDYYKVLGQRNALIKKRPSYFKEQLRALDRQLASLAAKIISYRKDYIKRLDARAKEVHEFISASKEVLSLSYNNSFKDQDDIGNIRKGFEEDLRASINDDIEKGYTSKGPHRDDVDIYLNGLRARSFASQGQQRSIILSIKLSELSIIREATGISPILLLDDVFSELDAGRRERVLDLVGDSQSLITCNSINFDISDGMEVFKVKEGKVHAF